MTCFQFVARVIRAWLHSSQNVPKTRAEEFKAALVLLSRQYREMCEGESVMYSWPLAKAAYMYAYMGANACHFYTVLERTCAADSRLTACLSSTTPLKVSSVGGGPGSELLGLAKYLLLSQPDSRPEHIEHFLLDGDPEWFDYYRFVQQELSNHISLTGHFLPMRFESDSTWTKDTRYLEADIFIFSYVLSELFVSEAEPENFLGFLFSNAKPGAFFFFLDNRRPPALSALFENLCKSNGIDIFYQPECDGMSVPVDENAAAKKYLAELIYKLGRYPKLHSNLTYRVGVKR